MLLPFPHSEWVVCNATVTLLSFCPRCCQPDYLPSHWRTSKIWTASSQRRQYSLLAFSGYLFQGNCLLQHLCHAAQAVPRNLMNSFQWCNSFVISWGVISTPSCPRCMPFYTYLIEVGALIPSFCQHAAIFFCPHPSLLDLNVGSCLPHISCLKEVFSCLLSQPTLQMHPALKIMKPAYVYTPM